jgi:hypothetical protein
MLGVSSSDSSSDGDYTSSDWGSGWAEFDTGLEDGGDYMLARTDVDFSESDVSMVELSSYDGGPDLSELGLEDMEVYYGNPEAHDCDFMSIRIRPDDLYNIGAHFILCNRCPVKIQDDRLSEALCIASEPYTVFVLPPEGVDRDDLREALARGFRTRGVTVVLNENPRILSRSYGRRLDAEVMAEVFQSVDLGYCFVYGFGYKMNHPTTIEKFDSICIRGGAVDNVFDIGRSFRERDIRIFQLSSAAANRRVGVVLRRKEVYPLFKHIGKGWGSLHLDVDGRKVRAYQLFVHQLKAASCKLAIPRSGKQGRLFRQSFLRIKQIMEDIVEQSGGYRIEVRQTANTISAALESICHLLEPEYWFEVSEDDLERNRGPILEHRTVFLRDILNECTIALAIASTLMVFNRRDEHVYGYHEQAVFADLCNLIGWAALGRNSHGLLAKTGNKIPPYAAWSDARRVPTSLFNVFNRTRMAQLLPPRRSGLVRGAWTLTLRSGAEWGSHWYATDTDMKDVLTKMVHKVIGTQCKDWMTRFVLRSEPIQVGFEIEEFSPPPDSPRSLPDRLESAVIPDAESDLSDISDTPDTVPFHLDQFDFVTLATDIPDWAVERVPIFIEQCLVHVETSLGAVYSMQEDVLIMEYVYQQRRQHREPNSVVWEGLITAGILNRRSTHGLRTRWTTYLRFQYEAYERLRTPTGSTLPRIPQVVRDRRIRTLTRTSAESDDESLDSEDDPPVRTRALAPLRRTRAMPVEFIQELQGMRRKFPGFTVEDDIALINAVLDNGGQYPLEGLAQLVGREKRWQQCQERLRNSAIRRMVESLAAAEGIVLAWRNSTR